MDDKLFGFTHGRGVWMAGFLDEISSIYRKSRPDVLISIYPNPVNNILHINMSKVIFNSRYRIFDKSGKLHLSGKFIGKEHNISVSSLRKGMYFIRFYNGKDLESAQAFVKF